MYSVWRHATMYITIDESDRRPVYRQVADEIKGLIARGELREGMALPPVRQVADDLKSFFKNEVFQTIIPRNIRLAEAPSYGKPILTYDVRSKGAESYIQLAKEILANEQTARRAP